jgi:hypothetical protein
MSTATCPSAPASTSTEGGRPARPAGGLDGRSRPLLAWALLAGIAAAAAAQLAATGAAVSPTAPELEAALAEGRDLYLVLDAAAGELQVRARGLVLDRAAWSDAAVLAPAPLLGAAPAGLSAPTVWRIVQRPATARRRLVAPASLRPSGATETELAAVPAAAAEEPAVEVPRSYAAVMAEGWRLEIVAEVVRPSLPGRLLAAVADGWARLRGTSPAAPPRLQLALGEDDARRLHHLMRQGTAVLVLP